VVPEYYIVVYIRGHNAFAPPATDVLQGPNNMFITAWSLAEGDFWSATRFELKTTLPSEDSAVVSCAPNPGPT